MYLTEAEYSELGFDHIDDFEKLNHRASVMIDLYTRNLYSFMDFDSDVELRKKAIKQAMALQISYMNETGITTAEDKQNLSSISIGRTSVSYGSSQKSSTSRPSFGLCLDALALLDSVGFGYCGVYYDR